MFRLTFNTKPNVYTIVMPKDMAIELPIIKRPLSLTPAISTLYTVDETLAKPVEMPVANRPM